jgi:hypothetical protein
VWAGWQWSQSAAVADEDDEVLCTSYNKPRFLDHRPNTIATATGCA